MLVIMYKKYQFFVFLGLLLVGYSGLSAKNSRSYFHVPNLAKNTATSLLSLNGPDTGFLFTENLAKDYIDIRFVDDTSLMLKKVSELQKSYPQKADTCLAYKEKAIRLLKYLTNSGKLVNGRIWVDSVTCINDYEIYYVRLNAFVATMQRQAEHFTRMEAHRLDQLRRDEEERQRKESQRKQNEANAQLVKIKETINAQNAEIESICLSSAVVDKAQIKTLRDILYNYMPIRNQYDLSVTQGSDAVLQKLTELSNFQRNLLDSVLGPNSYTTRINDFPSALKTRAGKAHNEVYRSYQKNFKKSSAAVAFIDLNDYYRYIQSQKDIITIQQRYVDAIHYREQIEANSNALMLQCGKRHKDIATAYQNVIETINLVPAFSTIGESEDFINSLRNFILVQQQYQQSIGRVEQIFGRGDSLLAFCTNNLSDVADAYKELVKATSFVPSYRTMEGADFFYQTLDNFTKLQSSYIKIIGLRNTIQRKSDSIIAAKTAPKGLVSSYKDYQSRINITPNFSNIEQSTSYLSALDNFIALQDKFISIIANDNIIESNSSQIKNQSKPFPNITKAYSRLLKSYDFTVAVRTEGDADSYLRFQETLLTEQNKIFSIMKSPEYVRYENQLMNEKDINGIKLDVGVKYLVIVLPSLYIYTNR